MKTLAIKTDQPEAELYIYDGSEQLENMQWHAHLKLAETLNSKIEEILNKSSISSGELSGIICFKGPGSFTGLRIGLSTANALAYANQIPIVATSGKSWIKNGIEMLESGKNDRIALPEYGGPAHITQPKK